MTEEEWRMRFADKLSDLVVSRGCTHREFAEEIGISEKTLDHYLHGRRAPSAKFLINFSKSMQYSLDKLMDFGEKIED